MELYERIALARKQAGLSQEQLGEKLGVSRQAVSKWETGQTNPDIAYIVEMCRLFGVSSDWLLGVEDRAGEQPATCPSCGGIVTPQTSFCPNCGRTLRGTPVCKYTLLLQSGYPGPIDDLFRLSRSGYFDEDSRLAHPINAGEADALVKDAPLILARGLSPVQVDHILDVITHDTSFLFYSDDAGDTPEQLLKQTSLSHRTLKLSSHSKPLSFWGVVGAVVVGLILTALLLSLL